MQTISYNTFSLSRIHRTHQMPLKDCGFNKLGDKFLTCSDDRTCKIWDINGKEIFSFVGHKKQIFCCTFNNPFANLVGTG